MQPRPSIRPYMQFLFVQSGFPLELPLPRFVASPQLFFRSVIPHHHGSLRTFTAGRISRRSYYATPKCGVRNYFCIFPGVPPLARLHRLICSFCSYSRDFPSNFLSHGSLPPRSCSSGLGFRIIAVPRGLSPQCAYRVGRT